MLVKGYLIAFWTVFAVALFWGLRARLRSYEPRSYPLIIVIGLAGLVILMALLREDLARQPGNGEDDDYCSGASCQPERAEHL
jgi:hypothetical protein